MNIGTSRDVPDVPPRTSVPMPIISFVLVIFRVHLSSDGEAAQKFVRGPLMGL